MNSLKPASLSFSLEGFLRRGGETDVHVDGWGMAFYEERRCQLLIDETAAVRSEVAQWVQQNPRRSCNMIAHIRKATRGPVAATNCHPFVRFVWNQEWTFAHNGTVDQDRMPSPRHFEAVGETDSEHAFCLLLDALKDRFGDQPPSLEALQACLAGISREIAALGTFNYVLSNGDVLLAHRSTNLHYLQRAYPFGRAQLLDCPIGIDFAHHNQLDDRMIIIATQPLTDEKWQPLPPGEVVAFAGGNALFLG